MVVGEGIVFVFLLGFVGGGRVGCWEEWAFSGCGEFDESECDEGGADDEEEEGEAEERSVS